MPRFLNGSYENSLEHRMTSNEVGIQNLAQRCETIETGVIDLSHRVVALEAGSNSFMAWRTNKPDGLTKLNYTLSDISLNIAEKVKALADKVDQLIDIQKVREITA